MKFNAGICTLVIAVVVTIVGGVIALSEPSTLSFPDYLRDLAIAWGLLGIGHGIDGTSKP